MTRLSKDAIAHQGAGNASEAEKLADSLHTIAEAMDQMRIIKLRATADITTRIGELISDKIRNYLEMRARAKTMLGDNLLFDPAWDILLSLYIDHADGRQTDIKSLIVNTGTPHATTTRWTHELLKQKLITRNIDSNDRRRVIVKLTASAVEVIEMVWLPGEALPELPPS